MILNKKIASILLFSLFINFSSEIEIRENSIFYDKNNNHFPLKVGDEFVFQSYTQIKESINPKCITLYKGKLYDTANFDVSDVDYYFSAEDTVVAIIPELQNAQLNNDYYIAIQLETDINSHRYFYSERFRIVEGGSPRKIATGTDACGKPRKSIYSTRNIPVISKGIKVDNSSNNDKSKNNKSEKKDKSEKNQTSDIKENDDLSKLDSNINNEKNTDDEINSHEPNLDLSFSVTNNTNINVNDSKKSNNDNSKNEKSLNYVLVFIMGILFCALIIVGFLLIKKKGKSDKESLTSTQQYNTSLLLPSDYGYNPNNNDDNNKNYNNASSNNNNHNINSPKKHGIINELIGSPFLSSQYSDASLVPSDRFFVRNSSISQNIPRNSTVSQNIPRNSTISQNIPVSTARVSVLEQVEAPSTDIKFVATTSYTPKNENEVAISSLDIVYIVGYLDENYAQILNITTNNYGVIPVNELSKIQP